MDRAPVTDEELAGAARLVERHFGYAALRAGQAETLARVLRGESVLAVLPTGSGKSVLYQLPGLLSRGTTLVVSPLVALMKDQLDSLPGPMRAATVAVTGDLPASEMRRALEEIAAGRYRLVYAAPERLRVTPFLDALRRAGVSRFVVDEAHCISFWGHDFRPDYLALGEVRRVLGSPPVLAATATAPPRVRAEIQARMGPLVEVVVPVFRPNLELHAVAAKDADEKLAHLGHLVRSEGGPVLVYASSRAKCETIAEWLKRRGEAADYYHAGADDRPMRQDQFMRGEVRVLVATVAFGMGVDKDDVRLLVHADPPASLEAYWQEAGRAGRDGKRARCVLLAAPGDAGALAQRARGDLPSPELVGQVRLLAGSASRPDGYALVPSDALASLDREETKGRITLNLLCEAGYAARLGEVPRAYRLDRAEGPLEAFRGKDASVFDLAPLLGVAPEAVHGAMLDLASRGRVAFGTWPADVLLRVKDPDASPEALLERVRAVGEERARTVLRYAKDRACRHAQIARYFADPLPAQPCGACDVCLGLRHELPAEAQPDDAADALRALAGLAGFRGIGLANLVYMLRGDAAAAPWTDASPQRGALASRSEAKVKGLVRMLVEADLAARETLEHGGESLRVTEAGLAALERGALPAGFGAARGPSRRRPAAVPSPSPAPGRDAADGAPAKPPLAVADADRPLFERLRAWRAEVARAEGVPAYVVAHDRTLAAIAAARPRTIEELRKVPGMGPKKTEAFAEPILAIVAGA